VRAADDRATQLDLARWIQASVESVLSHADQLTQLDAAIGDGDHGVNMRRGFEAVGRAVGGRTDRPPGELLELVGTTLVSGVGGASGALWGSFFRAAARELEARPEADVPGLCRALAAGIAAIEELGAARSGDKTMLDALVPAVAALEAGLEADVPPAVALAAAGDAAEAGARATVPLQARRGRASYLGERSIGHEDPGACSAALVMRALARSAAA
jgi:dihydroxyacetone kinase-like protein